MRLDLKAGEHIRLCHSRELGTFCILVGENFVHIRANEIGEPMTVTVDSDPIRPLDIPKKD